MEAKSMNGIRIGRFLPVVVCLFTCAVFIFTTVSCCVPQMLLDSRRSAWENRCKLSLRALGSTELAYQDQQHKNHDYGTWEELIDPTNNYIQQGYTKENIIDNYAIVIFDVKKSTLNEKGENNGDSKFMIVAQPKSPRNMLRAFAIDQNQVPYVWIGKNSQWEEGKTKLDDRSLWEPQD